MQQRFCVTSVFTTATQPESEMARLAESLEELFQLLAEDDEDPRTTQTGSSWVRFAEAIVWQDMVLARDVMVQRARRIWGRLGVFLKKSR